MKKNILLLLLLSFLSIANSAIISRGPYIENVSKNSAIIRFRTDVSTPVWSSYGIYPDCSRFSLFNGISKEHKINLNGLFSNTTYCYQIYLPVENSTNVYKAEEYFLKTFKDENEKNFSFLAFGDSGSMSEEQKKLAEKMFEFKDIDFVIHTGDLVDSGLDIDSSEQYFKMYAPMLKHIPFFIALGNHDYGRELKSKKGYGFLRENFALYHSVPLNGLPPHYYFFDIANARFIFLDVNSFYGALYAPSLKIDSKQYKWLEMVLKSTIKDWKFIVLHEPVYSSGEHSYIEEETNTLAPLFEKYKVDIVFQGHDHNYERTKPIKEDVPNEEGVIYITLGGGGRKLYSKSKENDWSEVFILKHHFAYFNINDLNLDMKVYDLNGEIIDSLVIQK